MRWRKTSSIRSRHSIAVEERRLGTALDERRSRRVAGSPSRYGRRRLVGRRARRPEGRARSRRRRSRTRGRCGPSGSRTEAGPGATRCGRDSGSGGSASWRSTPRDARLVRVDLPRVEVEDRRLPVDAVDALDRPARGAVRQQPEEAAAAGRQLRDMQPRRRDRQLEQPVLRRGSAKRGASGMP